MGGRSAYNGNNTNSGYGNSLPIWLRDPFFREIYEDRPHQVRP